MQEPARARQIAAESLESRVLWSVTYYVSPLGDDAAAGTSPATPFQTIARVNDLNLEPGDKVLFKGNASYGGRLNFDADDAGTTILPVTISSFGGKATIDAQGGAGIVGSNVGGFLIKNLNVVGGTNPGDGAPNNNIGIAFTNELPGNVLLDAVRIEGVDVSGFGDFGVAVGGTNLLSGYSAITVAKSTLHDNVSAGLIVFAQSPRANHGVLISRVNAFRNTGTGIIVGGTDGAKVERCSAFDNTDFRPRAGIWAYDSNAIVITRCKSFNNRASGGGPGVGGFGFISDVTNSQLISNQSTNNDGPGYLLADYVIDDAPNNHLVKSNRSTNDGQSYGAGIVIEGAVRDTTITGNRVTLPIASAVKRGFYLSNDSTPGMPASGLLIERNSFSAKVTPATLVELAATQLAGATNVTFRANRYKPTSGTPYVQWGDTPYGTIQAWRDATGQEQKS